MYSYIINIGILNTNIKIRSDGAGKEPRMSIDDVATSLMLTLGSMIGK